MLASIELERNPSLEYWPCAFPFPHLPYHSCTLHTQHLDRCLSASSCDGGVNVSSYCPTGNAGPLCAICAEGYRTGNAGGCLPCAANSNDTPLELVDILPVLIVGLVIVFLLLGCCYRRRRRKQRRRAEAEYGNAAPEPKRRYREKSKSKFQLIVNTIIVKVKIATAFQQVLQGLSGVFRIDWPPEFTAWLAYAASTSCLPTPASQLLPPAFCLPPPTIKAPDHTSPTIG